MTPLELAATLKAKLSGSEVCIGSWVMTRDPIVVEVMAKAGFDWLAIDMEHAPIDLGQAADLIRAGTLAGVPMLVRMPSHDLVLAKRLADAGVSGFIFPDVRTAEQAERLVQGVRYPNTAGGTRGVGLGRAAGYGRDFESYFAAWNASVVVVPQIEHIDAVEVVSTIAEIDGVDALFVGPYDLSASMGIAGQLNHPKVQRALDSIISAARAAGIAAGFHSVPPDVAAALTRLKEGVRFLAFSADVFMLRDLCDEFVRAVKSKIANG